MHQAQAHKARPLNRSKEEKNLYARLGPLPYTLQMSIWHRLRPCSKPEDSNMFTRLLQRERMRWARIQEQIRLIQ